MLSSRVILKFSVINPSSSSKEDTLKFKFPNSYTSYQIMSSDILIETNVILEK